MWHTHINDRLKYIERDRYPCIDDTLLIRDNDFTRLYCWWWILTCNDGGYCRWKWYPLLILIELLDLVDELVVTIDEFEEWWVGCGVDT